MLVPDEPRLLAPENQDFQVTETVIGGWVYDVVDEPIALTVVDADIVNCSDLDQRSIFLGLQQPLHYPGY